MSAYSTGLQPNEAVKANIERFLEGHTRAKGMQQNMIAREPKPTKPQEQKQSEQR